MLTELVNRLLELSKIRTFEIDGKTYSKDNKGLIYRLRNPEQFPPKPLIFNNLSGLTTYLAQIDFPQEKLFYVVTSSKEVSLKTSPDPKNENEQFTFATAIMGLDNFRFGNWYDLEEFIIALLGQFNPTADRDSTIEMLGSLANEHVIQNTDDKFSQSVMIKTGITTKAEVKVENPVSLQPFRTFREVEQPASDFILRYQAKGGNMTAALFEGDGGAWKLEAIQNIKNWLTEKTTIPVIG